MVKKTKKMNKNKLQEALSIVKPGLSNKEILKQTTSFAFLKGRVVTYNDEISISHPVEGIDFEGAIKAEELYGLLTRLNRSEIDLEKGDNQIKIKCGRVKAGLRLETEINLPLRKLPKKWEKLKNPEQFKTFVGMALRTCSIDMSQPVMTCVYIKSDGAIIGSDGFRFIRCQGHGIPVKDFLMPASSSIELLKIDPTHIQLEKNWIHFKNDQGTVFSCRRVNDKYISQEKIDDILKVKKQETIQFPKKIEAMLGRAKHFAKRGFSFDEVVEIVITDGSLLLKATSDDTKSWITEDTKIKTKAPISFMITPTLFEDVLKMTRTCVLDKGGEKVKFTMEDKEGGDYEYLIMLAK